MKTAKYFKDAEFKRCVPPCTIEDMEEDTLYLLDRTRELAGIPLVLNCAYRSVAYDKAKGRSGNSAHTKGRGVDIRCNTSQNRMKIVKAALEAGFTRIGIGRTFVHLDNDWTLPQNVIWHYYE